MKGQESTGGRVVVLVIAHKEQLSDFERISLRQCCHVFRSHPVRFICPKGLDVSVYRSEAPDTTVDFIDPAWQRTYAAFNRLKVLPFLYQRFRKFEFVLFYELDAFVFRDDLLAWCDRGYDYIGAPWFEGYDRATRSSPMIGVGNGGFSLRRTASMLRVTSSFRWVRRPAERAGSAWRAGRRIRGLCRLALDSTVRNNTFAPFNSYAGQEDRFWGHIVPERFPWYRVAPVSDAVNFSFEVNPRLLYESQGHQLPFGCHAWPKYDPDFWRPHIEAAGYTWPRA